MSDWVKWECDEDVFRELEAERGRIAGIDITESGGKWFASCYDEGESEWHFFTVPSWEYTVWQSKMPRRLARLNGEAIAKPQVPVVVNLGDIDWDLVHEIVDSKIEHGSYVYLPNEDTPAAVPELLARLREFVFALERVRWMKGQGRRVEAVLYGARAFEALKHGAVA